MKFNTKNLTKNVPNTLTKVAGIGVGLMLPNAVADFVAGVKTGEVATAEQQTKKMYVHGASAVLGTVGLVAIEGDDLLSEFVKYFAGGVAGGGIKGLANHFLSDTVKGMSDGTAKQMLSSGLGCACQDQPAPQRMVYPALNRALRVPTFEKPSERVFDLATLSAKTDLAS